MTAGEKFFIGWCVVAGTIMAIAIGVALSPLLNKKDQPDQSEPTCPADHEKTRPILVCSGQSTIKLICREKTETYCEVQP